MSDIRDKLTYSDLAGRRKLRRYVVATIFILLFALGVIAWSWWQRGELQSNVMGGSQSTAGVLHVILPSTTPLSSTPTLDTENCPAEPSTWKLLDVFPNNHYKRIEPACVYDGLSEAVAWYMLTRIGYSAPDAAKMMGFADIPRGDYIGTIQGMTATKGPMDIPVSSEAFHPDLQQWSLKRDGSPAVAFSLRGCYRTLSISGKQVEEWGAGYPVVCTIVADYEATWGGYRLGPHIYFNSEETNLVKRGFLLFGYVVNQNWELIGQHRDLWASIENSDAMKDREFYASQYKSTVWDATWLLDTFDFDVSPLPEDWQSYNDPEVVQIIADAMNGGSSP